MFVSGETQRERKETKNWSSAGEEEKKEGKKKVKR
jgi:hypothetical protein